MNDPCNCVATCPHGDRCLGGHASYPDSHWYPCGKCTPKTKTTFAELRKAAAKRRARLDRSQVLQAHHALGDWLVRTGSVLPEVPERTET
jgi:hypothetical protein